MAWISDLIKGLKSVFISLARALQQHPAYAAVVLVLLIGSIVSGATVLLQIWRGENSWFMVGVLLFASLALVLSFLLANALINKDRPPQEPGKPQEPQELDPTPPTDDKAAIARALAAVQSMVNTTYIKRNLLFQLTVKRLLPNKTNPRSAEVSLRGQFEIENLSASNLDFVVVCQIEVGSKNGDDAVPGDLKVYNSDGSEIVRKSIEFSRNGDGGLQRVVKHQLHINPRACYRVEWSTTGDYIVDLPYREFWATAHPVVKIEFVIKTRPGIRTVPLAECYRLAESARHDESTDDSEWRYTAFGPFLPYQGLFVRAAVLAGDSE